MGNSASSQGSSTGTHDGDVGSSISEEQHDWPIEQAADEPDVHSLCRRCENLILLLSYLAPFSRYGDLLAKNCIFLLHCCYPSLIRRPRSLCSPWNFALKLAVKKLESWGYPPVKTA